MNFLIMLIIFITGGIIGFLTCSILSNSSDYDDIAELSRSDNKL